MKFVYEGEYACFDGYTFMFRKPVEVITKPTIEKLLKNPKFKKVEDEKERQKEEVLNKDSCPKCGKAVKKGMYLHQKHCKGSA